MATRTRPAPPPARRRGKVTRAPVYPDDRALGGPYRPGADYFLLVGKTKIGGTYWAGANPAGQRWTSWGVAGLSQHHRTRELAEQAQVDAYQVYGPDLGAALARVAAAPNADRWCWG